MRRNIIIADNFYDNPDEIRNVAINLEYPEQNKDNTYPGRNSSKTYYTKEAHQKIQNLIGKKINYVPSSACGDFRISYEKDTCKQYIHVDGDYDWGGVIFLNPPEQCIVDAGTSFYRHKSLRTEKAPTNSKDGAIFGYTNYQEVRKSMIYEDGFDKSKWDCYLTTPMVYNRIVLFRPWLWHSHSKNFGDNIYNCRLVQLLFYKNE
jgi:hypothetical protein